MPSAPDLLLAPMPRIVKLSTSETASPTDLPTEGFDPSLPPEGYVIHISSRGSVNIGYADSAGLFYAHRTLKQLARNFADGRLPVGTITDWPDLPVRGVMLDVSRCRVPTMKTLYAMIDRLSEWKINHLELYIEHTFAYTGHDEVWRGSDPFTAAEIADIARYCAQRHIELVPNQNTLGHMERWLIHDTYEPLGIRRGTGTNIMGMTVPASTLDPARPDSLALASQLVGELGECLPGRFFNVGLDEPWDLPAERSDEWSGWLGKIRNLDGLSARELLVWGDMLSAHPDLTTSIPDGVTVCEWGYDSGHPFQARGNSLAEAGVRHWHCPGTSSWLSIVGRTTNAIDNCREAAEAAGVTGATGYLTTDWGDWGHHQSRAVSDPGLLAAAAFSWCLETNADLDAEKAAKILDLHAYGDTSGRLGRSLVTLGDLYRVLPLRAPNISGLVLHLYLPQLAVGAGMTTGMTAEHLDRIDSEVERCLADLAITRCAEEHGSIAASELATSARLLGLASHDARARLLKDGKLESIDSTTRSRLADELESIVADYRHDWLVRDRPGGLEESCAWLYHLMTCYRTGVVQPDWAGPLVETIRARDAQR